MVNFKLALLSMLFVFSSLVLADQIGMTSTYTSVVSKDCKMVTGALEKIYPEADEIDGGAEECKGNKNWRLIVPFFDARSWVALTDGKTVWDTVEYVMSKPFGQFPNVGEKVEWRSKAGKLQAIIFRIEAQDGETFKKVSRLFVVGLDTSEPKFCGIVKTNEEARKLADKGNCTGNLEKIVIK
ncbi:MAG: hypothetical protein KBF12_07830 [Sebaldella sp.]|nr:hypothetical protein [Sebaldella sp.]